MITSKSDKDALKYLSQVELVQDVKDPRPFSLKFVCLVTLHLKSMADGCSTSQRTHTFPIPYWKRSTHYLKVLKLFLPMEVLPKT